MFKKLFAAFAPWILVLCLIAYTVLSWVLLFRDKRALEGISTFYPQLHDFLFSTRDFLLQNNLNTIPTFFFAIVSIVAFFCYIQSLTAKISLRKTIMFAALFFIITFFSYPILTTDIFSYMFSERVTTVHNENIWKVKPAAFPQDPFYDIADWKETTSVYGASHFVSYFVPSAAGQNNLLLLTILYKIVPALFALGTGYIFYLLLKLYKPEFVEQGLRLVFWSPLFVLEIFGSGHNDSLLIFFTLLSILFYKKKQWVLTGVALALAVHVKILPVLLLFFMGLLLLRQKQLRSLVLLSVSFLLTNSIFFTLMQISPIDYVQRVLYNGGVYWQSLPNLLRYYISGANIVILLGFLLWFGYFVVQQLKESTDPIYSYAVVLLVYLLFVSSAYWNWYVLWILPLLPFVNDKKVFWTTLVFTFTSLMAYPLLWLSLRFGFGSFIWPIITYLFIFGIPIGMYVALQYKKKEVGVVLKRLALQKVFADKVRD